MSENSEIIFDLDGTLADLRCRLHHIQGAEKDYPAFYDACDTDIPIKPICQLARSLHAQGYRIRILTGRSEITREKTRKWLLVNKVPCDELIMRPIGDHRPDTELKQQWHREEVSLERTLCIFEDRKSVVDMWRSWGYTCLQVKEGDF